MNEKFVQDAVKISEISTLVEKSPEIKTKLKVMTDIP